MQHLFTPRMTAPPLTVEVLEGLDAFVHTERFLHKLQEARRELDEADEQHQHHLQQLAAPVRAESLPPLEAPTGQDAADYVDIDRTSSMPPAAGLTPQAPCHAAPTSADSSAAAPPPDGFVVVEAQDAVEGMAYYIALYISSMPEARKLDPKQLQGVLKEAFKVVRRSRFKLVWDWGRWLYRWSAFSYGMVSLYDNPWVMRALLTGIWTAAKAARFALGHML